MRINACGVGMGSSGGEGEGAASAHMGRNFLAAPLGAVLMYMPIAQVQIKGVPNAT